MVEFSGFRVLSRLESDHIGEIRPFPTFFQEGLLPWRDSGAAFSLSPTTRSDAMAQS